LALYPLARRLLQPTFFRKQSVAHSLQLKLSVLSNNENVLK